MVTGGACGCVVCCLHLKITDDVNKERIELCQCCVAVDVVTRFFKLHISLSSPTVVFGLFSLLQKFW